MLTSLLASCYEDKGNYSYDESITDISVKLNQSYGVRKADTEMTYTITPEIKTDDGDKSYLKYTWVMNTTSANSSRNDTIGHDESLTLTMDPTDPNFVYKYYIKLYVTDTRTNTKTMAPTTLEVGKPFTKAWMVLHEKDDHAELGSVEYIGSVMMVTPDAYKQETGKDLTGKPVSLSYMQKQTKKSYWLYEADSQLFVTTTNSEESGLIDQTNKFKLMATWTQLFSPLQIGNVDFNNFQTQACPNYGLLFCSKGHMFSQCGYSPFLFQMSPEENLTGDCSISKFAAGPHTALGYDNASHRFVHIALQSAPDFWGGYKPSGIKKNAPIMRIAYKNGLDARDPNHIPENENVINIVNGYHYQRTGTAIWQRYNCYAYSLAPGNMSHVYVFSYYALTHTNEAIMRDVFEFPTPEGINENTPMTSGATYNNIIFYAAGNKVYKLDISTGSSKVIYQSDDARATISCLRIAVGQFSWNDGNDNLGTDTYEQPYSRLLGVAVNKSDGTGELVVLQLNAAGKVDDDHKFPSTQIHKGFGKIKDIAFI